MTVQKLINELNKVENKKLPIFGFLMRNHEMLYIQMVDTSMSDRIEINLKGE